MGRSNDSSMRKRQQDDKNRKSAAGGKRSRLASDKVPNGEPVSQKKISHVSHAKIPGCVLTMGEGDTGQLGLGPDVMERVKPAKVDLPKDNVVQVYAGGMHTVCLTAAGEVYTFGCNDEGALGRQTADEDECMVPGRVDMAEHIVQISAGDSHTAFLSDDGRVFACGTFRDANGPIGLVSGNKVEKTPVELLPDQTVVKIDSGTDHLVCLTKKGEIFTLGCADQGQLGRVAECFAVRGGRKGIGFLLIPGQVHVRKRGAHFCDVWTGQYTTYAQEEKTGIIYAWGLNNYYQIGFADMENRFVPSISKSFNKSLGWKQISGGQHHAIALDKSGDVYALGRKEYGRLGFGKENLEEKSEPCVIPGLQGKKCSVVNSGTAVSFAVSEDGNIYAWGMGSTQQLGQTEEDDIYEPQLVAGKHLEQRKGLMVSAGGQHTVILATDKSIGDN